MSTKGMSFYQSKEYRDKMRSTRRRYLSQNGYEVGSRREDRGYVLIYFPEHPNSRESYIYEHRLVMEKHIGRYLKKNEVVHHINGIINDNRIENLQLMTNSEHSKFHVPKGSRVGRNAI